MAMTAARVSDIVADPVSHISISGVHGRDELNARLAHASRADRDDGILTAVGSILLGAAAGALIVYLLDRTR